MKRPAADGARSRQRPFEMLALAPIVAFGHHVKQDSSRYPENVTSRRLNLCTITGDRDDRGEHPCAVVEAVDPESVDVDPLEYL